MRCLRSVESRFLLKDKEPQSYITGKSESHLKVIIVCKYQVFPIFMHPLKPYI